MHSTFGACNLVHLLKAVNWQDGPYCLLWAIQHEDGSFKGLLQRPLGTGSPPNAILVFVGSLNDSHSSSYQHCCPIAERVSVPSSWRNMGHALKTGLFKSTEAF